MAFQEFVKAVVAYQKKLELSGKEKPKPLVKEVVERQRRELVHSFSMARVAYKEQQKGNSVHNGSSALEALQVSSPQSRHDLEVGAEFLEVGCHCSCFLLVGRENYPGDTEVQFTVLD